MTNILGKAGAVMLCVLSAISPASAQFAPQAGISGSDAVAKSSNTIKAWATGCSIRRGLQQIDSLSGGYAASGDSSLALGIADGAVVSLGDSGVAVLTFASPIVDGPGADFAVFENGFTNPANGEEAFLELAFVEVSSDGAHFVRFPATSLTPPGTQLSSIVGQNYMNARLLNNLAGKYISGFGTPFDLQELAGTAGLDVRHITHVRLVDVIGTIGARASLDASGNKVNDPFPTAFPTGGFDLDAVAVMHQQEPSGIAAAQQLAISLYPNPVTDQLYIYAPAGTSLRLTDAAGRLLSRIVATHEKCTIPFSALPTGLYYLTAQDPQGNRWTGKISKQ